MPAGTPRRRAHKRYFKFEQGDWACQACPPKNWPDFWGFTGRAMGLERVAKEGYPCTLMKLPEPRNPCEPEREDDRLAQRVARLEEELFVAMERIGIREKENARLCEENRRLHEENARLRAEVERLGKENARLRAEVERLGKENARLRAEVERLGKKNTRLQQQLAAARKDSSTSSKPPSSDIVKPKKPLPKGDKKRTQGGQPGHEQHLRKPLPPEAVQHFKEYPLDCCPVCNGKMVPLEDEEEGIQQVEILQVPIEVTEHRGLAKFKRPISVNGYPCSILGGAHGVRALELVRALQLEGTTGRYPGSFSGREDKKRGTHWDDTSSIAIIRPVSVRPKATKSAFLGQKRSAVVGICQEANSPSRKFLVGKLS